MKVVALVTAFNKQSTIIQVVESLLKCEEIDEVIVLNDASTDDTAVALDSMDSHFLRILHSSKNRGVARSRNILTRLHSSCLKVFVDGDDVIIPGDKDKQLRAVKHEQSILFSYSDYFRCSQRLGHKYISSRNFSYARLCVQNFIPFSSVVVRGNPKFERIHHEDYKCWLTFLDKVPVDNVHYYNKATFIYGISNNSLSSSLIKGFISNYSIKKSVGLPKLAILRSMMIYMVSALSKRL